MSSVHLSLARYHDVVRLGTPLVEGEITQVLGLLVEGTARDAAVGDLFRIRGRGGESLAEVVALRGDHAVLVPFSHLSGLRVGDRLAPAKEEGGVPVGRGLLGRVIDGLGRPLDGRPLDNIVEHRSAFATPPPAMDRPDVTERLPLGVRSLDAFVPCGRGQRLGIFAGAGVGKSVLLGMIASNTAADVAVLALVGERGREVGHFIQSVLTQQGMKKTIVVVSTSDRPAPERVRAAFVATTVAEYFRDQGAQVLLFVDSLTRLSMAQRQIGLAIGEPPTTKGYPPSSFAILPQLLERACPVAAGGSVTGMYTVLMEGDDLSDPVADAARSLLDGHIVLSRRLAEQGHFPAVDVLKSLSRLEGALLGAAEQRAVRKVRAWLGRLEEARDLIAVGAYRPGADPLLDKALKQTDKLNNFLRQRLGDRSPIKTTQEQLFAIAEETP